MREKRKPWKFGDHIVCILNWNLGRLQTQLVFPHRLFTEPEKGWEAGKMS